MTFLLSCFQYFCVVRSWQSCDIGLLESPWRKVYSLKFRHLQRPLVWPRLDCWPQFYSLPGSNHECWTVQRISFFLQMWGCFVLRCWAGDCFLTRDLPEPMTQLTCEWDLVWKSALQNAWILPNGNKILLWQFVCWEVDLCEEAPCNKV